MNFSVVPVIKDKPKIIKVIKKRTVIIECTVASKFEPKCTWFKETNEVKNSTRHTTIVEQTKEGEFNVKLEINEVQDTDKGSYKVVAKNEKGEAVSQVVQLTEIPEEEGKPTKPEISRKLTDQKVVEEKSFELISTLKKVDKKCKVTWYKNNTVIKETREITTTFDGTTARLTYSSAKTEHTGTYKVVFTNEAGTDESSAQITVTKKDEKKKKKEEEEEEKKKIEEEKKKVASKKTKLKIEEKETKTIFDVRLKPVAKKEKEVTIVEVELFLKKTKISKLNLFPFLFFQYLEMYNNFFYRRDLDYVKF